jgi:tricorn protease-like protein
MKIVRRNILLLAGLAVAVVAAVVVIVIVLGRDENSGPRLPGRVAVQDGCGIRHMWQDGTDVRTTCLTNVWDAVSLSWDGKTLAWDTVEGRVINVAKPDGLNATIAPLPTGQNIGPSLSPNGQEVAFLHSPRDDGRYDVWVGSTSTDNAEQLTSTSNVSDVAWSPTGKWIAYVQNWSEQTLEGQITLIRPNGDDKRDLVGGDAPDISPNGKQVAFVHNEGIWTVGTDGKGERLLVKAGHSPAWSRDGNQIAFMRAEKCQKAVCKERVFLVGTGGGDPRPVGPTYSSERRILWLPDPFE